MSRLANVVVTGGAGFLGSHLVDALVARGHTVTVFDNLHRGRAANLRQHLANGHLRFVHGDIRDSRQVAEAMAGADWVYHLAAQSNVMGAAQDVDYSFSTNVVGTFNILRAAAKAGTSRVVFSSSREAYGEAQYLPVDEKHPLQPKNPYGASKVAAEMYCATFQHVFGLPTVVLRFTNIYGPRDFDRVIPIWLERATAGQDLEVFGGDQVIDFLWVGTAVEALLRAAEADVCGEPLNVGSGSGTPIGDLAARILRLSGASSRVRVLAPRGVEVVQFVADVGQMKAKLGFEPPADPLCHLEEMVAAPACGAIAV